MYICLECCDDFKKMIENESSLYAFSSCKNVCVCIKLFRSGSDRLAMLEQRGGTRGFCDCVQLKSQLRTEISHRLWMMLCSRKYMLFSKVFLVMFQLFPLIH